MSFLGHREKAEKLCSDGPMDNAVEHVYRNYNSNMTIKPSLHNCFGEKLRLITFGKPVY